MSSFIVGNETIDKILSGQTSWTLEEKTRFGKKLLELNVQAVEERYLSTALSAQEKAVNYEFRQVDCTEIEAYKALNCFMYQCSEGNAVKRKLYREMQKKEASWAYKIISETPEYNKARWG